MAYPACGLATAIALYVGPTSMQPCCLPCIPGLQWPCCCCHSPGTTIQPFCLACIWCLVVCDLASLRPCCGLTHTWYPGLVLRSCCCCCSWTIGLSTRYHCLRTSCWCRSPIGTTTVVELTTDSRTSLLQPLADTWYIAGHTGGRLDWNWPDWIVGLVHHFHNLMTGMVLLPSVLHYCHSLPLPSPHYGSAMS